MVLNLDKCIGCHTCSVTCKNVWTGREGMEYAWFNNVETKPGIGYPKNWEDQEEWQGGWIRGIHGKLTPRLGGKMGVLSKIFANPFCRRLTIITNPSPLTIRICTAPRRGIISHRPPAR
jgi:nitrate reductase beta subunit